MQYLIETASPLAGAVAYALAKVLEVPAGSLVQPSDAFGVKSDNRINYGILPMLQTLRKTAATDEHKAFLGAPGSLTAAYVNQWVSAATLLSVDASYLHRSPATYQSLAKTIYLDVDLMLDASDNSRGFLAATPRATIADLLLYAALHNHPEHKLVGPTAMEWSVAVQADPYFKEILNSHVRLSVAKTLGQAGAAAATPAYVKPSEEEIQRRRAEKEKAKAEKEKAKAAAAAQGSSGAEGKAAAAAAPAEPAGQKKKGGKEDGVSSLEIRVGRFANVRAHPDADRLYVEDMIVKDGAARTIVSGLVDHYPVDQLNGTLCLVVCNMKPKPLKGVTSEGMVLCASTDSAVRLVRPPEGSQPGDRIVFGPATDEEPPAVLSGNKMTELLSHLHTDADGTLCWKELQATHNGTPVAIPEMKNCTVR